MHKIIYILFTICLLTSCEENSDVPFLNIPDESAQLIAMDVEAGSSSNKAFTPIVFASQMIVDWGDGSLPAQYVNADTIVSGTSMLKPLKYTYASAGSYIINVRAVKISRLDISKDSARQNINKLQLVDCRHLKSFSCKNQTLKSVDIAVSGIKALEFGSLSQLVKFSVLSCDSLFSIVLNQNPVLNTINLSNNPQLSAQSLNAMFQQLPQTVSDNCIITLSNNAGDAACDKSIAIQKGWKVNVTE